MAPLAFKYSTLLEDFFACHAFYQPPSLETITPGALGTLNEEGGFNQIFHLVHGEGPLKVLGHPKKENTTWGPRFSQNMNVESTEIGAGFQIKGITFKSQCKYSTESVAGAVLACSDEITSFEYGLLEPFKLCVYAYARQWRALKKDDIRDFFVVTKTFTAPEAWTIVWRSHSSQGAAGAKAGAKATVYEGDFNAQRKWYVHNSAGAWNSKHEPCVVGFNGLRFRYRRRYLGKYKVREVGVKSSRRKHVFEHRTTVSSLHNYLQENYKGYTPPSNNAFGNETQLRKHLCDHYPNYATASSLAPPLEGGEVKEAEFNDTDLANFQDLADHTKDADIFYEVEGDSVIEYTLEMHDESSSTAQTTSPRKSTENPLPLGNAKFNPFGHLTTVEPIDRPRPGYVAPSHVEPPLFTGMPALQPIDVMASRGEEDRERRRRQGSNDLLVESYSAERWLGEK